MKKILYLSLFALFAVLVSCEKESKAPELYAKSGLKPKYESADTLRARSVFYGANTFPWVPVKKITMFKSFRCYIATGWVWRPGGLFVQPMYQAETQEASGLDVYFARCRKAGISVLPCINQTPEWFRPEDGWSGSNDYPPIKKGLDRENPNSYADYAEFWYQFVCRYGKVKHADSTLRVDTTPRWSGDIPNKKQSGLNLLDYVEIGNEFDRWWDIGTEKYLTPKEHAALFAAVIKRVKQADPKMKVVMAGLTGFDVKYLNEFLQHLQAFGSEYPDVINVHHYSNIGNNYGQWPPTWYFSGACMPHEDLNFDMVDSILSISKAINRPVWVTEFGCDSRPPSWMHIDGTKYGMTDEHAQGMQLVEQYKTYRKKGIDRAFMFMAADEAGPGASKSDYNDIPFHANMFRPQNASAQGLWQSCGILTSQQSGYNQKQSFWPVKKLIEPK